MRLDNWPNYGIVAALGGAFLLLNLSGCAWTPHTPEPLPQTEAEVEFQNGAKRAPTAKTLYALAQILATQGKDPQAEAVFEKIITEHPEFLPAYCDLAELQMRTRHIEKATRILNAALQRAPNQAILVNDLGMCQMINGNLGDASQSFTRACSLAPDNHRYRSNLATVLGMQGRYDEALSLYIGVMSPADAHFNLAILCDARHDVSRATTEYKTAALFGKP